MTTATTPEAVHAAVHDERVAARLGLALAIAFTTCFLTGLYSHLAQHPSFGFQLPSRPVGLYRVTQGLHVVTGIASIPLLLAKLWSVYPKLFAWPPFESLTQLVERLAIFPLVAGSIFMLFTGLANINLWYPWKFNFPDTHFRTAWIVMGALAIHIGAKFTTSRRALRKEPKTTAAPPAVRVERRRFLLTAFGASSLVALFTVGQTFRPLARLALLAPRRPDVGPQGFPVNGTAKETGAARLVHSTDYHLEVAGNVGHPLRFTLAELRALPQHSATLPITCVEGWSTSQRWTGVRVRDLLAMAGAPPHATSPRRVVPALRQLPDLRSRQLAVPRSRHAARTAGERRRSRPRPRLPLAPHRAEPAGGDADQMGEEAHGAVTPGGREGASRADRIGLGIGLLVGVPTMLVGVIGIWRHTAATPIPNYLRFFIGADIVHDFVVAPVVALVAFLVLRRVPAVARAPVRAALFGSAIVTAVAWPGIRHYGRMRTPDNGSVQPLNYATSTLTAIGVVVFIAAVWFVIAMVRSRRNTPAPAQPVPSNDS